MTTIHRLHLFHFLNNKVFFATRSGFVNTADGTFVWLDGYEEKSFGRVVDWTLDVVDDIVFEWLPIGYFVDNLRLRKYACTLLRWLEKHHEETT